MYIAVSSSESAVNERSHNNNKCSSGAKERVKKNPALYSIDCIKEDQKKKKKKSKYSRFVLATA